MNMHWADEFAKRIVKSGKYKPYWVDDMKTPSGRVHIGSIRAVLTHELTYRALLALQKKVNFSYVLDDQDPFDKIPAYLDEKKYREHLGKPLYKVPSPETGYKSYGHQWGQEYIEIFNSLGVTPKIIWGSELYLSGKMDEMVKVCLDKADRVIKIYKTLYKQEKPKDWLPFQVVCEKCGKLSTTSVNNWDGKEVSYECKIDSVDWTKGCGHRGKISPFGGNGKLPWKVEWPCKWKVIGVTVEGAGKDHMGDGGSHDFAKLMCKNVINYPVPFAFSHEFFLIGGKKMSSSRGVGTSAKEVSEIIPPFLIRFMIAKVKYNRAINFDPGGMTIPDLYDEYTVAAEEYWDKKNTRLARSFELSKKEGKPEKKHFLPRFRDVAMYIQHKEVDIHEKFEEVKGSALTKSEKGILEERIKYAKIWLDGYAPKEEVFTPTKSIPKEASKLSSSQKKYLGEVLDLLNEDWKEPEGLQTALYDMSKEIDLASKKAFAAIYIALTGKNHGPRAAWFLLEHAKIAKKRFGDIVGK